jgi:hypothetical protein
MQLFKSLFDLASPNDLKERGSFSSLLAESLENQKFRLSQYIDEKYLEVLASIESHFHSVKSKVLNVLSKEHEKLLNLKEIFNSLSLLKTIGAKIDEAFTRLGQIKAQQLITSLSGITDLGSAQDIKKLAVSGFDFSFKTEIPAKLLNLTTLIVESPMLLIKGNSENSDISEKKLARFNPPTNRWGIFEGRNQIEAVTFSVNQKVYMTGLGIGNAYHAGKIVKIEKISILEGGTTSSPAVYDDVGIDLIYEATGPKVVKIPFKKPVEIKENVDFTIKLVLRGGAGVFRGGNTTRTRNGENGLVFKFKNTVYSGDDVKNGENADDGPIFDIYYKTVIDSQALLNFSNEFNPQTSQELPENRPSFLFTFNVSKPINLTSFSVPSPNKEDSVLVLKKVELFKNSNFSDKLYSSTKKIEYRFQPSTFICQVSFDQSIPLESHINYSILLDMSCQSVFKSDQGLSTPVTINQITLKPVKSPNEMFRDALENSIILGIQGNCLEEISNFTKIVIPDNFLEEISGEMTIKRFESFEPGWSINTEGQVECFSFNFSEEVLLTGVSLGNCVKANCFVSVETLNVLLGQSSNSPAIYEHPGVFNIFNSGDHNPVVKVKFSRPVKIEAKKTYSLKVVMKGNEKVFKGKGFKGENITGKDSILFRNMKTDLKDGDKANGDNETGGPILQLFYFNSSKITSSELFSSVFSKLHPKIAPQVVNAQVKTEEFKVSRYSNIGSSWHVNTDGKQIEAISFKPSMIVKLTAVGIGNAHEEQKKVVVKKVQIKEGKSTQGRSKVYKHKEKVKLINTGEESRFVKILLEAPVTLTPDNWYTLMVKYKPGVPVCRGTMANNQPSSNGVSFTFEKTKYEGPDIENGSHEVHGPLRDFYFTVN